MQPRVSANHTLTSATIDYVRVRVCVQQVYYPLHVTVVASHSDGRGQFTAHRHTPTRRISGSEATHQHISLLVDGPEV